MPRVERRDHIEEVVRMAVRDQHRIDVTGRDVLLQTSEGARSRVEPEMEATHS